jgi:hypothetical protein
MIGTNWRKADIEKAGLRTGDTLTFSVDGEGSDLVFYASPSEVPGRDELSKGARLMTLPPRGGETYMVQFIAMDTAPISARLKPLLPIEVKKK